MTATPTSALYGTDCRNCDRFVSLHFEPAPGIIETPGVRIRCGGCGATNYCERVSKEKQDVVLG